MSRANISTDKFEELVETVRQLDLVPKLIETLTMRLSSELTVEFSRKFAAGSENQEWNISFIVVEKTHPGY